MKRMTALALAAALLVTGPSSVVAASANINPAVQTVAHGTNASWALSWGHTPNYLVHFHRGDGSVRVWSNVGINAANDSRKFYPCSYTTYGQWLRVWDKYNPANGTFKGYADDTSTTSVSGGSPC
jgi:hypothetical protein